MHSKPPYKAGKVRFPTVPLKSYQKSNHVEDSVVFLTFLFISVNFSFASYKQEMRKSLSQKTRK